MGIPKIVKKKDQHKSSCKSSHPSSSTSSSTSSSHQQQPHADRDMDLANAGRGVWLVKVPKYIAERWERTAAGTEIAKIRVKRQPQQLQQQGGRSKTDVSLELSDAVVRSKLPGEQEIPRNHKMDVSTVIHQTLGVFSREASISGNERLSMEGTVIQKFECRPLADSTYMNLKLESIRRASQPKRQVKRLDRVVQNFRPVSDHRHNIEYAQRKKGEGKALRQDKNVVLEMLFAAFEKHQYYNIKDLVKITRQPVVYLKEILNEVCNYNVKNPHRNMWELKPEYRHYNGEVKEHDGPKCA